MRYLGQPLNLNYYKIQLQRNLYELDEAMKVIADYIEPFYNQKRRHSTLGNVSPAEYEQKYQQKPYPGS